MRAIRIHETGGPEVLRLEEVELPKPGKGEVRLRQHAIGVNFVDVYFRNGFYPTPSLPFTPGGEAAGEVVEVGLGVEEFKPGDRVASASGSGAYAEERNVPAQALFKLPRGISYETAAAMMLKGLTAQYLLHQTYRVKEGDWISFTRRRAASGRSSASGEGRSARKRSAPSAPRRRQSSRRKWARAT